MRRRVSESVHDISGLRRLGMATATPFVGRSDELVLLGQALRDSTVLVVQGAVGAGKTRLVHQLCHREDLVGDRVVAYVRCQPGDREVAVRARAERALGVLPGDLKTTLHTEPRLLVVDDLHYLDEDDATRLLAEAMPPDDSPGRLLLLTRDTPPMRRDLSAFVLNLAGLDEAAARDLWLHLEATYGPTRHRACDNALLRTRGMPLALRREYARDRWGDAAWCIATLPDAERQALTALAVLRLPAAPAAVAAVVPNCASDTALAELTARQLVDALTDGRFRIHDIVRGEVLATVTTAQRCQLEQRAAAVVATSGAGRTSAPRLAWEAGDDGALGPIEPIDRVREEILHHLAAGDLATAVARLCEQRRDLFNRGGLGEIEGLLARLRTHLDGAAPAAAAPLARAAQRELADQLRALRGEIAVRQGHIAHAMDLDTGADPVTSACLLYRAGDVAAAWQCLDELSSASDADTRCRAAALQAEIALARGDGAGAEEIAADAFARDRAEVGDSTRALLHLALAGVEERAGRMSAARMALSRAASSGRLDPEIAALIKARQAVCLAREGRLSAAEEALAESKHAAQALDAAAVADQIRRCHSMVAKWRGDTDRAAQTLEPMVAACRDRGDAIGALHIEMDLARVHLRQGRLTSAAQIASACRAEAMRLGLESLIAAADLVDAAIDAVAMRVDTARGKLEALLHNPASDAEICAEARVFSALVRAQTASQREVASAPAADCSPAPDPISAALLQVHMAMVRGDDAAAAEVAWTVAVDAERVGRRAELVDALALRARLCLRLGDRSAAAEAAHRAAEEALDCGLVHARVIALLVLAAIAHAEGHCSDAEERTRAAVAQANAAGLPVERLAGSEIASAICGDAEPRAAAATMSPAARAAAAQLAADLGLNARRPYRVVSGNGDATYVADPSPERLNMADRSLSIDGVREIIIRNGTKVADLRRRSLLKRLLFLFAGAPGHTFSKETIVEQVWDVEYHPLRHDAALFTNIMRIRRLLGKDGADLIRVNNDGYRLMAPQDFVYVQVADHAATS